MSNRKYVALIFLLIPALATAQEEYYRNADPSCSVMARASAEFDWRISDGLHLNLSEEARLAEGLSGLDKSYTTLGLSYKPCPYLKAAASYSVIYANRMNDAGEPYWRNSNRVCADLSGLFRTGFIKISLRERFQYTMHNYELNVFQKPQNALALRTRLKASLYLPGKPLEPYVSAEFRYALNAVDPSSLGLKNKTAGTVSYSGKYIDRYRGQIGIEWRLDRRNWLDFYLLGQYDCGRKIDANAEGKLKKIQFEAGQYTGGVTTLADYSLSLGIAYKFGI